MDFLALPRRDLQALCKRNGVRANLTNSAMADALRALPKIEGIEEYVKQPVPVPEPEAEAVVEQNIGRGRRAVAKSSEPIETEEDNADAQAIGVGQRGASRRARPVPVVPQPAAVADEDTQREVKKDNAPAPAVGRRARPSPAVAAAAAQSEVAGAEEEQREEKVENLKLQATMDDVPARRGASRRARPPPSVVAMAGKVVAEEEQRAPIPRSRRVKAKGSSSEPIRLHVGDDEDTEDAKLEVEAQILGVGRRGGASWRAQAGPAVSAPEAKAEEEQRAAIRRGRHVKAKSIELIGKEEKKEDTKPEEEKRDAPAIAVGGHCASRRALAPPEAPATRRSAAASKAEAGDVAVEAVPVRATRQRKPTIKAAEAAAEKAPRRATKRGAVIQEEPQDDVSASAVAVEVVPIRPTRQRNPTMKAAAAATMVVEKAPPRARRRGVIMMTLLEQKVQEEPQEAVGALFSYQRCNALEELEETSDPQKEELNQVDATKQDEDGDVIIIEAEKLMEETPIEEPSDDSEMQERQVNDEKCHAPLVAQEESPILGLVSTVTKLASEEEEGDGGSSSSLLHKGLCEETFDAGEEMAAQEASPILGLVSTVTKQASEDNEGASFLDDGGSSSSLLDKGSCEETSDAGEEMELVPGIQTLQAPSAGNGNDDNQKSDMGNFCEVPTVRDEIKEVDTQEVSMEKEHRDIAELQADIVDEATFLDCLSIISQVVEEEINEKVDTAGEDTNDEVNTEDDLGCQEEGDVVVDKVLHYLVDNTIFPDCSRDIHWVEIEKAGYVTSEMPKNPTALDVDGDKLNEVVIVDSMSQVTVTDEGVQDEKGVVISDEMLLGITGMHDDIEDDQVVTTDSLLQQVTDCEITVEENATLIVDERQQITVAVDEDIVEDNSETDVVNSNEQIEGVATEKVRELNLIEDVFVQADHVVAAETLPEQVILEDYLETVSDHADEKMEVVTIDKVLELAEDVEKTQLVVNEKQKSTGSGHGNEQKKAITADIESQVLTAEDEGARKEIALHDDITESLSKSIVTMGPSVCKNSSENLTEPMAVLEEKGVKVASESEDLTKLSLRQLKAKLKEKLNAKKNKEAKKRGVTLARVDENICRKRVAFAKVAENVCQSHTKGQQQKLDTKKNKQSKKRVALARVDENVCRKRVAFAKVDENFCPSHAKGQQQNLNPQQL